MKQIHIKRMEERKPCNGSLFPLLVAEAREVGGEVKLCSCGYMFISKKGAKLCNYCSNRCKTMGEELKQTQKKYWQKRWEEKRK